MGDMILDKFGYNLLERDIQWKRTAVSSGLTFSYADMHLVESLKAVS